MNARAAAEPTLTDDWETSVSPAGARLLRPSSRKARQVAGCAAAVAAVLTIAAVVTALTNGWPARPARSAEFIKGAAFSGVALLAIFAAFFCATAREEWKVSGDHLERRRTFFGKSGTHAIIGASLVVEETGDADGGRWFHLYAIDRTGKQRITHSIGDPSAALSAARWIAFHTGWRLTIPDIGGS